MLIRFKVSNFLSFDDEQEFSMIKGITRSKQEHVISDEKISLLKFSSIFGANASGKSNFIKSIFYAKNLILHGSKDINNLSNMYCKIKSENKNKITTFDFEIKIKEKYYSFGFDILLSERRIKEEWLYELDNDQEKEMYVRKVNNDTYINESFFNDKDIVNRLNIYAEDMKNSEDVLFLTVMNKNKENLYNSNSNSNINILNDIYLWFKDVLTVISPYNKTLKDLDFTSPKSLEKITEIVSKLSTGISKCRIVEIDSDEMISMLGNDLFINILKEFQNRYLKLPTDEKFRLVVRHNNGIYIINKENDEKYKFETIKFNHKNNDGEYSFMEQSDGTRRIIDLIEILIKKDTEKVYLVDELDRCLHPQMTYKFVELFLNDSQHNNVQLIVSTHESRLLNFKLLRRDEIWFANKEKDGHTKLYSLEEFNERFDKVIDKAYLEGRYGGVPIFETLYTIHM